MRFGCIVVPPLLAWLYPHGHRCCFFFFQPPRSPLPGRLLQCLRLLLLLLLLASKQLPYQHTGVTLHLFEQKCTDLTQANGHRAQTKRQCLQCPRWVLLALKFC